MEENNNISGEASGEEAQVSEAAPADDLAQAAAPAEAQAAAPAPTHLRRRQVRHPKYRRYIRRRSKFLAHDELGAHIGDIVRIVSTRPLSARKRWRVVEIVQKAS